MKVNTNKNKNKKNKSVAKKTAVKKVVKNKNTKRKLSVATPSNAGRPPKNIPVPLNGNKFTISSIYNMLQKRKNEKLRATKITITKFVKNLINSGKVAEVGRKQPVGGRGAPIHIFAAV